MSTLSVCPCMTAERAHGACMKCGARARCRPPAGSRPPLQPTPHHPAGSVATTRLYTQHREPAMCLHAQPVLRCRVQGSCVAMLLGRIHRQWGSPQDGSRWRGEHAHDVGDAFSTAAGLYARSNSCISALACPNALYMKSVGSAAPRRCSCVPGAT